MYHYIDLPVDDWNYQAGNLSSNLSALQLLKQANDLLNSTLKPNQAQQQHLLADEQQQTGLILKGFVVFFLNKDVNFHCSLRMPVRQYLMCKKQI